MIRDDYFKPVRARSSTTRRSTGSSGELRKHYDDHFSHYLDPHQLQEFESATSGRFSGVGLTVTGVKRGLRVATRPAAHAGPACPDQGGRSDHAVDGRSLAGVPAEVATARIKGPPGTSVELRVVSAPGGGARKVKLKRASVAVPVAVGEIKRAGTSKVAYVRYATFSEGAHGELASTIQRLDRQGRRAWCSICGVTAADCSTRACCRRASSSPRASWSSRPTAARMGHHDYDAVGDPLPRHPIVVLINHDTASAAEILASALGDHHLATIVGTRSFGKGTFQEVIHLGAGGASTSPWVSTSPRTEPRLPARGSTRRHGRGRSEDAAGRGAAQAPRRARREDGRREQVNASPRRRGARASGRDAWSGAVASSSPSRCSSAGPQVALDRGSIDLGPGEIGLVDFGPRRRTRPACARLGRERARRGRRAVLGPRAGSRLHGRARVRRLTMPPRRRAMLPWRAASSLTSPPSPSTRRRARDFDDAVSAETRGGRHTALDPHRRRRGPCAARWRARLRGAFARHQHLRARVGRADAPRGAERRRLQPGAGGGPARGDRRDRPRRERRASVGELLQKPHPLRCPPRLRPAG